MSQIIERFAGASVIVREVTYWAEYPGGRRVSVTEEQATRNHERWKQEGVRVVSVIRERFASVFDQLFQEYP